MEIKDSYEPLNEFQFEVEQETTLQNVEEFLFIVKFYLNYIEPQEDVIDLSFDRFPNEDQIRLQVSEKIKQDVNLIKIISTQRKV